MGPCIPFFESYLSSLSLEDDITVFPAGDNFICERVAKCKFDITLEHDIMVLSLRKKIIRLKLTLAFFFKNLDVVKFVFFEIDSAVTKISYLPRLKMMHESTCSMTLYDS